MSKILLPFNNSTWGVITHQVAPDEYEHVLSFENESIKKRFIGLNLFNDESFDYTEKISNQRERTITKIDDMNGTLSVDVESLNEDIGTLFNYSIEDLLSTDSMFVSEHGIIKFYIIVSAELSSDQNNQTILFTISEDVLFNSIDELQIEGQVPIIRSHIDRINKNGEGKLYYLKEENSNFESELNSIKPDKLEKTNSLIYNNKDLDGNLTESKYIVEWMVIYNSIDEANEDDDYKSIHLTRREINLPYEVIVIPFKIIDKESGIELTQPLVPSTKIKSQNPIFEGELEKIYIEPSKTYGHYFNDPRILSINFTNSVPFKYTISLEKDYDVYEGKVLVIDHDYFEEDIEGKPTSGNIEEFPWYEFRVRSMEVADQYNDTIEIDLLDEEDLPLPLNLHKEEKNIELEVKLKLSQFTDFKFLSREMGIGDSIIPEYIPNNEKTQINNVFGFQADQLSSLYTVDNEKGNYNIGVKRGLNKVIINEIPTVTDAYLTYIANSKSSSGAGRFLAIGRSAIAGAAGGFFVGGAAGATVGGIVGASSNVFDYNVKMGDLKNAPDIPSAINNAYGLNQQLQVEDCILKFSLRDNYKKQVYNYLFKYGYENPILANPLDLIKSRYYFNYIKTGNIFSLIKNKYSGNKKQIINDAFRNGVTIWHVRDLGTFKGISNYINENIEMNVLEFE